MSAVGLSTYVKYLMEMPLGPRARPLFSAISDWSNPPTLNPEWRPQNGCTLVDSQRDYFSGSRLHESLKGGVTPLALAALTHVLPKDQEWAHFSKSVERNSGGTVRLGDKHFLGACLLRVMHFDEPECEQISKLVRRLLTGPFDDARVERFFDDILDEVRRVTQLSEVERVKEQARFTEILWFILDRHSPMDTVRFAATYGLMPVLRSVVDECSPVECGNALTISALKNNKEAFFELLPRSCESTMRNTGVLLAEKNEVELLPVILERCSQLDRWKVCIAAASKGSIDALEIAIPYCGKEERVWLLNSAARGQYTLDARRVIAQSSFSVTELNEAIVLAAQYHATSVVEVIQARCEQGARDRALVVALKEGHWEGVELLLQAGTSEAGRDRALLEAVRDTGPNAQFAVELLGRGIVQVLLEAGTSEAGRDRALLEAVTKNFKVYQVAALIRAGTSQDIRDRVLVQIPKVRLGLYVLPLLLEAGCREPARDEALLEVTRRGLPLHLETLLRAGCSRAGRFAALLSAYTNGANFSRRKLEASLSQEEIDSGFIEAIRDPNFDPEILRLQALVTSDALIDELISQARYPVQNCNVLATISALLIARTRYAIFTGTLSLALGAVALAEVYASLNESVEESGVFDL